MKITYKTKTKFINAFICVYMYTSVLYTVEYISSHSLCGRACVCHHEQQQIGIYMYIVCICFMRRCQKARTTERKHVCTLKNKCVLSLHYILMCTHIVMLSQESLNMCAQCINIVYIILRLVMLLLMLNRSPLIYRLYFCVPLKFAMYALKISNTCEIVEEKANVIDDTLFKLHLIIY